MIRTLDVGRFVTLGLVAFGALASLIAFLWSRWMIGPFVIFAALTALGALDLTQRSHSILRNHPVLDHMRILFEGIRPEIRQYLIESDQDEEPFDRGARSLVFTAPKRWRTNALLARGCGSMTAAIHGSRSPSNPSKLRTPVFG